MGGGVAALLREEDVAEAELRLAVRRALEEVASAGDAASILARARRAEVAADASGRAVLRVVLDGWPAPVVVECAEGGPARAYARWRDVEVSAAIRDCGPLRAALGLLSGRRPSGGQRPHHLPAR